MKTASEELFERFCLANALPYERVPTGAQPTVDFHLLVGDIPIAIEVEQIESRAGFGSAGVLTRTLGSHVRAKISEARKQLQAASRTGLPTVLLINNQVDPHQLFGTEQSDFLVAMYGELTVHVSHGGALGKPFHGLNARLRENVNTSFSGVGHLRKTRDGAAITVYENVYAAHPLPFGEIPRCIEIVRVEIDDAT